jgi:hypothetical protein
LIFCIPPFGCRWRWWNGRSFPCRRHDSDDLRRI